MQETETLASSQPPVVILPEKGCLDRTSAVSQSIRHLTIERETVSTAQVQLDSNRLSAEAAVEHSSILLENNKDSDVVCACCLKRGNQTELRRCAGCKIFSYCIKECQISDWPSHKQMCKPIQSLNQQKYLIKLILYIELRVNVFCNFHLIFVTIDTLYTGEGDFFSAELFSIIPL